MTNTNMRRGFTMIELIFVIVIIGILAAVAIPKLSATRDDAKISKGIQEVAQAVNDIGAYYTAHGKFDSWDDMTNVALDATAGTAVTTAAHYEDGNGHDCVTLLGSTSDGNLTVTTGVTSNTICDGISDALDAKGIGSSTGLVHEFGGSRVSY